jgi:hypothetical protein
MPKKGARRTQKVRKGGYYGFNGALATGAANWTRHSEMGEHSLSNRGGNAMYGAGRRRRGKKVKKTGRRTKKVMRGGTKFGGVSASFQGTGARGIADAVGVSVNKPGFATQGEFNNYGAQPGSGYGSFITTSK